MEAEKISELIEQIKPNNTVEDFSKLLLDTLMYQLSKTVDTAINMDWFYALSIVAKKYALEDMMEVTDKQKTENPKFVNYLSMEFLIGRLIENNLVALGIFDVADESLKNFGINMREVLQNETEPALGNGGLGRLAACFLESMATLNLPAFGYGIRYDYGMFHQKIIQGQQVEVPDEWLLEGFPWEIPRQEIKFDVPFGGELHVNEEGKETWQNFHNIIAKAHDILIPGFGSKNVSRLRLWSAYKTDEEVLELFAAGDFAREFHEKTRMDNLSSVLYPDDRHIEGKELRLKQEYFLVSATVQDILYRYTRNNTDLSNLPNSMSIHLNDTHPALAIPEFMRLATQQHGIEWITAWEYCTKIFSYTNHTLMPEALESWDVGLLGKVIPAILDMLYQINFHFLQMVSEKYPQHGGLISQLSIVEEGGAKTIRMGSLCVIASHKVNGVSAMHSDIVKNQLFAAYNTIFPEKFINVTNGVTPRRWLTVANRRLSDLINSRIGNDWCVDLDQLATMRQFASDAQFQEEFGEVKNQNKLDLVDYLREHAEIDINPDSMFDVQIKRIHEYKRQLLNILHVIHRYNKILSDPNKDWVPRTVIFSGKAASSYNMAKMIIRFINDVAHTINNDSRANTFLKVCFIPNYCVEIAEKVIPAANLSEQISTAGTEASGTGNMKLALNGALTIGTADGANLEIMQAVGEENIFIFGQDAGQVNDTRSRGYDPQAIIRSDDSLSLIMEQIKSGYFSHNDKKRYTELMRNISLFDHYQIFADFHSYAEAQDKVDQLYKDKKTWLEKSIINFSMMGTFSSDISIKNYAEKVWNISA